MDLEVILVQTPLTMPSHTTKATMKCWRLAVVEPQCAAQHSPPNAQCGQPGLGSAAELCWHNS